MTCVDSDAIYPFSIPQGAASHAHIINAEWNEIFLVLVHLQIALEFIQEFIFFLTFDHSLLKVLLNFLIVFCFITNLLV